MGVAVLALIFLSFVTAIYFVVKGDKEMTTPNDDFTIDPVNDKVIDKDITAAKSIKPQLVRTVETDNKGIEYEKTPLSSSQSNWSLGFNSPLEKTRSIRGDETVKRRSLSIYPSTSQLPSSNNETNTKTPSTGIAPQPKASQLEESKSENLGIFAPYGSVIECELLYTLDSIHEGTPIVGIVTKDLWWNGHLVLPANSMVHGPSSKADFSRERIVSNDNWVIVLEQQNDLLAGREMKVKARLLDKSVRKEGKSWNIDDGSYGIRGYTVTSKNLEELKFFASTFLATAASSFQEEDSNPLSGITFKNTARNAALSGTSESLNRYADQLLKEIESKGAYIRVPTGKTFYLYLEQTLVLTDAQIGINRS